MESFYIPPRENREASFLGSQTTESYNTSQLFPGTIGRVPQNQTEWLVPVETDVGVSENPSFASMTEQATLTKLKCGSGRCYSFHIANSDAVLTGRNHLLRSRGKYLTLYSRSFDACDYSHGPYIGKLRSSMSGSKFRFVPADFTDSEMSISYCPRIFRSNSSLGPCRDVNVHLGLNPQNPHPSNNSWNILTDTLDSVDLESVPPEQLDKKTCALHFPSNPVIPSVKNFQLCDKVTKSIVFSFHKEEKNTYRALWAPDVITRPIWAMCLGISSVEYKICTQ